MNQQSPFGVATAPDAVRFERLLPGPIERVWAYLTESDKRRQWLSAGAMAPRVGAVFEMRFEHASLSDDVVPTPEPFRQLEGGHVSQHRITRWEPPKVLAITWSDGAQGESEVTFELTPHGAEVRLVLTHSRLANRDVLRRVAKGWHTHLDILTEKLNGRSPKSFWTLLERVEAAYDREISAA
jgi:uncharacterized protein YndB with AHSA1/START domain